MSAQRTRLNTIASNIANAQTTRTAEGGPYKRQVVVLESHPFQDHLKHVGPVTGVRVAGIYDDPSGPIWRYEPDHPDANEDGYVAYPNVNVAKEMADLIQASRSYEANISSFNVLKDMATAALEIGR